MPDYQFIDSVPCFAPDASFRIRDCMVYRMQDGQEVAEWDYWNYQRAAPAGFPIQAIQQFWQRLRGLPLKRRPVLPIRVVMVAAELSMIRIARPIPGRAL